MDTLQDPINLEDSLSAVFGQPVVKTNDLVAWKAVRQVHDFSTIFCASCGHSIQIPVRCGLRFCSTCSRSAAARTHARLSFICNNIKAKRGDSWKFLTLTIASQDDLNIMITSLIAAFRRLRSRNLWKEAVRGGVYVLEVTHSPKGWHAHLHVIMMARYIPQHFLSRIWKAVSGSPVLDIRQVKGKSPVGYVTHYLTKFDLPPDVLAEAETAIRNRRLWSPFGIAHDLNQQYKPAPVPCPHCGQHAWISERAIERGFAHVEPDP